MAKFLPSELISAIRNKAGASVFSVNRGGAVVRAYQPVVANPNTTYQRAQRAAVKSLMSRWTTVLTEAQRIAWEAVGKTTQRVDVLAQRYTLTGANHFMAVNLTLNSLGFGPVDDPPFSTYAGDCGPLSLVADSLTQSLVLTARNGLAFGEVPFIRATSPLSPGVNLLYSFLRVLPFPVSSPGQTVFDLSSAWIARWGSLPQDKRIGVHLQYVNSTTGALGPMQPVSVVSSPQEVDPLLVTLTMISQAAFINLAAAPVVVVPNPGAGLAVFPFGWFIKTHNTSTPFAGGSNFGLWIGLPSVGDFYQCALPTDFAIGLNVDLACWGNYGNPTQNFDVESDVPANFEGTPLYFGVSGADFSGGDGPVDVTVFYVLVATP